MDVCNKQDNSTGDLVLRATYAIAKLSRHMARYGERMETMRFWIKLCMIHIQDVYVCVPDDCAYMIIMF